MTTRTAIAAELSMMLQDRIGGPEIPRVDVRMWPGVGSSWNLRAGHWPDEVDFGCTTEDLSEPWKTFGPRILAPVADELARLHSAHLTAHVRAGLNPYRPGKMAEVRKPRRVKDARTSPGPWSEPRKLRPFELYRQGREIQVAQREMPLPEGARFLPPASEAAEPLITVKPLGEQLYWLGRAHIQREGEAFGRDLDERVMASLQAASVERSGFINVAQTAEAVRQHSAGLQDAGGGVPGAFQIVDDDDQPWPARRRPPLWAWGLLAVGVLAALFRIVVLCIAP